MSAPYVRVRSQGSATILTLARPEKGNALSPALVEALDQAWSQALAGGARSIVLEGEGKHFCTGFDLSDLDEQSDGDLLLRFVRIEQLLRRIYDSKVVTVALAQGRTVGAGADLFTACDHRIALPGASFSFPGAGFGLVLGTARLAERVGRDAARDLVLSGKALAAEVAQQCRLATEIVTPDAVTAKLDSIAETAARLDPETVAAIRQVTMHGSEDGELAALVRSAAAGGLKQRIQHHRNAALARSTSKRG